MEKHGKVSTSWDAKLLIIKFEGPFNKEHEIKIESTIPTLHHLSEREGTYRVKEVTDGIVAQRK